MIWQQLINGLMLGGIYVLIAVSFTLAIGILNFLNFSLPGLFMLGGVLTWALIGAGWHWSLAMLVALLAAAAVSLLVEQLSYKPMRNADPELPLVSSLGFLVLMENLVIVKWGSDQQSFPALIPDFNLRFGGLIIGTAQLISFLIAVGVVLWLSWFLKTTNTGRRLRAIAENRDTAEILGINLARLVPCVFVFSAVFTALGGILFALNYLQVSPFMGENIGFKGVAAMIVGGMGSIWGAIVGGLLIGLVEVLSIYFFGADVVNILVYGFLLLVLIVRPAGLLGRPISREKL
ncbi:branched-chain amino acid ABC transporter permease [Azoarcus indigens]|uniref:Branched-chain amino acid transport system permease protein n=1 Tax=Azoarcus indigens TaxID=29545 RepID=A0A4R6DNJ9_9RHOO|nr:branched-chain amino acid ABC transporter permease [Azoarcus indigens]NMG65748.1 branched-chain amino acid ABC transporter permease [Azoarcus indigens]TDN46104.1 branched-chain amino acid transport system permease protein [Azoarcus indigens]